MTIELVPEGVSTPPPTTSTPSTSWLSLEDHITPEHFAALRAMAGLTVDPDVLHINGNTHEIQ